MSLRKTGGRRRYIRSMKLPPAISEIELSDAMQDVQRNRERIIEGHLRLARGVAGKYLRFVRNDGQDLLGSAFLGVVEAVDKVARGDKVMHDGNIAGVIVEHVHNAIARELEMAPLIRVPSSTNRSRKERGEKPLVAPEVTSLSEPAVEDSIRKQGWWHDCPKVPLISEIEIRDFVQTLSPLERRVLELKTSSSKPMSDREVAREIGSNPSAVFNIRKDIGDKLRELVTR